jgi:hypothetical protein
MIDYLGGDLPVELMALILYKHKGLAYSKD